MLHFGKIPKKIGKKLARFSKILAKFPTVWKKTAKNSAILNENFEIRERRLFATFFDLRSWLSVSSPLRSVGTPSPLPRGSCSFKPGNNLEPCTDSLELCRRVLHLRKSEQRKFGYQMLSANSTKRNPCIVFVFHLYSHACHMAFI